MATGKLQARNDLAEAVDELTDADVVFEVATRPGLGATLEGSAMELIRDAIQASIRPFAASVSDHLEKVAVLEEIPKSSVTIWFNFLPARSRSSNGGATSSDPLLLKFAAQGLLTILSWMSGRSQLRLADLQQAIRVLVWGASATSASRRQEPSSVELMKAVAAWERVKRALQGRASARLIMQQGSAELDLEKKIPELTGLLEKKLVNPAVEMILIVELPDYNNSGEWQLKHGQTHFTAKCRDCNLLRRFYQRELDIRPGDGLHCIVEFDSCYGPDSELVEEVVSVVDVLEVIPGHAPAAEAKAPRSEKAPTRAVQLESAS